MSNTLLRFRRLRYAFDSLLGEILMWILILLLVLWALSVIMTYQVASNIARTPYDELLVEEVKAVANTVRTEGGRVRVNMPRAAEGVLRADARDKIYFQVLGSKSELLAGDKDLPWVAQPDNYTSGEILLRDEDFGADEIRVAYTFLPVHGAKPVLVQVGETLNKRTALTGGIISGVIVPQFVIVPLAVLLMYLGLSQGVTPLHRLQDELRSRMPTDLTPISTEGIPSEIRPLLTALNDVMVRLDENLVAQRRFIADAAHQLKTPLTGLKTQTELALNEADPERVRSRLEHVAASAENLSHLTRQLLALAKAEATMGSREGFHVLELNGMAREATMAWADRAIAKNIELAFDEADQPINVVGSPFLLRELMSNLVDNAVKYTPPHGQITVRLLPERYPVFEVEDTGIGVAPEERERVFERFYRVLGTQRDGSGLGLAIVKEIADLHRARVHIESGSRGFGTLVRVSFPRAKEA